MKYLIIAVLTSLLGTASIVGSTAEKEIPVEYLELPPLVIVPTK